MKKGEFYKDSFSAILNQYLIKLREEERLEHKSNVLLVIAGVVGYIYFSFNLLPSNNWKYLPFIPLIVIYFISIYNIIPHRNITPWIAEPDFKKLEEDTSKDTEPIYKQLICEMYSLTTEADRDRLNKKRIWILASICFLIWSFSWLIIINVFFSEPIIMFVCIMFFSYVELAIIYLYWNTHIKKLKKRMKDIDSKCKIIQS